MLLGILDEMGRGNTVAVIPVQAELTTQEAADVLGISRPSLIQLLDEGKSSTAGSANTAGYSSHP